MWPARSQAARTLSGLTATTRKVAVPAVVAAGVYTAGLACAEPAETAQSRRTAEMTRPATDGHRDDKLDTSTVSLPAPPDALLS